MPKFLLRIGCAVLAARPLLPQVTTSQYDNARTGANLHETILTPRNVNVRQFGRVFVYKVDGDVYAQPLYLPRLDIPGQGKHDVVLIATEHDSVYAFDAAGHADRPLWKVSFTNPQRGTTTVPANAVNCGFISPELGITSSPVIDEKSRILYVLARTVEPDRSGTLRGWQRLHALDVRTGAEKLGGPVAIRASMAKPDSGFFGLLQQQIEFGAIHENPRASLVLANGIVYLSWASSCDVPPYYGWVIAFRADNLKQMGFLNTAPVAGQSGIWQSDTGPASDEDGNLYALTGNGVFDAANGGQDYGDSVIKLGMVSKGLAVKDYFTPRDEAELNRTDGDLGSGGPLLVPQQPGSQKHLLLAAGKSGVVYVLDRDHLGKFHAHDDRNALSTVKVDGHVFSAPAYWNGLVYLLPENGLLDEFVVRNDRLVPFAESNLHPAQPGATPVISANGAQDGIVWVVSTTEPGLSERRAVLQAFSAANVQEELYSSNQNSERDQAGAAVRFVIPLVANGRVYVGTAGEVDVYGLLQ